MKKTVRSVPFLFITLCLLAALLTGTAFAAGTDAAPLYDAAAGVKLRVLIPAEATEAEADAAQTLLTYLEEITGEKPALVTDAAPAEGGTVALSQTALPEGTPKGSYVLRYGKNADEKLSGDPVFYIDAADARGVYNGVFGFLRRICGVEIYSTHVRRVPKSEKIAPDFPYWYAYTPTLEYADTDWISPHDLQFSLANGLNGTYSPIEALQGGKVNYLWFCHSLTNGIVPESEFLESHPEYYALQEDGTRQPTQLCLSNPDVIAQAKKDVRKRAEEAYNPDAALNILSVTQDDNYLYCRCENCTALAEQYGGQSGLMLWFVNQIAEDIEPDYPDLVIDTFAYQYTRQAPTGIVPRDNVCVRLCSIECCFAHPLDDPNCEANVKFMKDLEDWSRICSRLYVWDYVTNFAQSLCVFPNFQVLRSNIDTFRNHNVVGIYEEGPYYADPVGVEFYDLRAYMLSVLMRDEMTAEEELAARQGFLEAYYGGEQSAAAISEILDILGANAGNEDGHLFIYSSAQYSLFRLSDKDASRVDELWKIALSAAKENGDEDAVTRIENARLAWRYYEACTGRGEAKSIIPGFRNVRYVQALIDDLKAAGVTRYSEGHVMDDLNLSPFVSPADWDKKENNAIIVSALVCATVVVALCLAAAVTALRRKHPLCALLIAVLTVAGVPLGAAASELFILWDNLPLYGCIDALLLLTVAGFCLIAAWAKNGAAFPKGKKAALTVFLSLLIAAAPYEIVVLIINTLIYHGLQPLLSIALSGLVLLGIVAACAIIIIRALGAKKKQQTAGEA